MTHAHTNTHKHTHQELEDLEKLVDAAQRRSEKVVGEAKVKLEEVMRVCVILIHKYVNTLVHLCHIYTSICIYMLIHHNYIHFLVIWTLHMLIRIYGMQEQRKGHSVYWESYDCIYLYYMDLYGVYIYLYYIDM